MEKILIVAPRIPLFDKHAGELRLLSIIKIFSKQYKIIFFDTQTWGKVQSRYFEELKKADVQIYSKNTSFKEILKKHTFSFALLEFFHIAEYSLPRIRLIQPNCFILIDSVDVHFMRERMKFKITHDPKDYQLAEETQKRELKIYAQADQVITVTQEDADILIKYKKTMPIEVIPTIHDVQPTTNSTKDQNNLIFIGGFKHEPNVDAIEYFCKDVFPLLIKTLPEIKFNIIGPDAPKKITKYASKNIKFLGFVPSVTPYLNKSYISIAPLRYGSGIKGKIGEAMTFGVPVVTTPVGIQGMNLTHKENIMVANHPDEYVECIKELISNKNLYNKISKNSKEYAKQNYSSAVVAKQIEKMCKKMNSQPVKRYGFFKKCVFGIAYVKDRLNI